MQDTQWDPRAEEEPDPDIQTGVGNPLSPYNDAILSEEDEKRMDDKGLLVVQGEPWSKVPTGYFIWTALWLGGHENGDLTQLVPDGRGQTDISLEKLYNAPWSLSMGVSLGRPRFNIPTVGACLEIPQDLAEDELKKKYVAEWLVATISESFEERSLPFPMDALKDLAFAVEAAGDRAIGTIL